MVDQNLLDVLECVNVAYAARKADKADEFMAALFDPSTAAYVTGTSCAELSFDKDSIKQLFVSDWQYWQDLRLEADQAVIKYSDDFAWIHCPGTLKYSFSGDENTYSKFVAYIKEYYDGTSDDSQKPANIRLAEINWLLAHLLHDRLPARDREYFWPVRVFFVLRKIGSAWKIKHIQFSLPHNDPFADARFSSYTYFEKLYKRETAAFAQHTGVAELDATESAFLDDFRRVCLGKEAAAAIPSGRFFAADVLLVDSNNSSCRGDSPVISRFTELRDYWDSISLDSEIALVDKSDGYLWIHTTGLFRKKMSEEFLNQLTETSIKEIFDRPVSDKDKLFLIRRNIALRNKELAYGTDFEIPFRFDACISRRQGRLLLDYVQFSLPLINILEQINEEF